MDNNYVPNFDELDFSTFLDANAAQLDLDNLDFELFNGNAELNNEFAAIPTDENNELFDGNADLNINSAPLPDTENSLAPLPDTENGVDVPAFDVSAFDASALDTTDAAAAAGQLDSFNEAMFFGNGNEAPVNAESSGAHSEQGALQDFPPQYNDGLQESFNDNANDDSGVFLDDELLQDNVSSVAGNITNNPPATVPSGDSQVPNLNLPFDPKATNVQELAAYGHDFLNGIYSKVNHFLDGYQPHITLDPDPLIDPQRPPPAPIYPAYTHHFDSSEKARTYRKRARYSPKKASDLKRVKDHGRFFWVRRIYNSMIDISKAVDGDSSIHRQRLTDKSRIWNPLELEAAAHHVFDECLAVHERGWNRPIVYHKKVVRGKLADLTEGSIEKRLELICKCLKMTKAAVDDALRGGVTLALLCDNPEARCATKLSNNTGNKKRGERLKKVPPKKDAKSQKKAGESESVETPGVSESVERSATPGESAGATSEVEE